MLLPLITTHSKLDGAAEKNGFLPYTVHNIRFAEKKVNNKIESTVLSKAH